MISVVIPAHNEEANIPQLVVDLQKLIKASRLDAEIVLIDDNSTDSTPEICDSYSKKFSNIRVVHRSGMGGMGNALKDGTATAKGDIIVWTMADLTDDLDTILEFIKKINKGADMVFGSRYMKGGSSGNLQIGKKISSCGFSFLSRVLMGIKVHDVTNAFRAFRKDVYNSVTLESGDFGISPEFALKAHLKGFRLEEVPTSYKDRVKGATKFKMFSMGKRYLGILLKAFFRLY